MNNGVFGNIQIDRGRADNGYVMMKADLKGGAVTAGFGPAEFVAFCRAAGFEPVVTLYAFETPEDAADIVEYFNGSSTSKMGS